jgi:prophage maintenance system killer protein
LADGNERLASLATVVSCRLNGFDPRLNHEEAFQLGWDIASTRLDAAKIAE